MPSDGIVEQITLIGFWFVPDPRVDKYRDGMTNRMAILIHECAESNIRAEVTNSYIVSVIIYGVTVMPCPKLLFDHVEGCLVIEKKTYINDQVFNLTGGLDIFSLSMRRYALTLRHLQKFIGGEDACSSFLKHAFS